jgi:uncharacterized membrane protein
MRVLSALGEILLAGLLALLPIWLTIQVLVWVFGFADHQIGALIEPLLGRHIPGLGVLITLGLILIVGLLTKWWVTERIIAWAESVTLRIPGLGHLYKAIKRLLDPLTRKEDRPFREAVWVPLSDKVQTLGFITSGSLDTGKDDGEERVSVFLPTCHPYYGLVTVAKRSKLRAAPVKLDEAISYEFSFGAATPPGITVGRTAAEELTDPAGER